MRRARKFNVSGCLLNQIFTSRANDEGDLFRGITSDAPEDMRLTGLVGYDAECDLWTFVCESQAFEPVPEGAEAPPFTPAYTVHFEETKP